jgi:hypothetical protein
VLTLRCQRLKRSFARSIARSICQNCQPVLIRMVSYDAPLREVPPAWRGEPFGYFASLREVPLAKRGTVFRHSRLPWCHELQHIFQQCIERAYHLRRGLIAPLILHQVCRLLVQRDAGDRIAQLQQMCHG